MLPSPLDRERHDKFVPLESYRRAISRRAINAPGEGLLDEKPMAPGGRYRLYNHHRVCRVWRNVLPSMETFTRGPLITYSPAVRYYTLSGSHKTARSARITAPLNMRCVCLSSRKNGKGNCVKTNDVISIFLIPCIIYSVGIIN